MDPIMATVLHLALLAPVALALFSSALTYWQGWTYFSEKEPKIDTAIPGASVIVPLRGSRT